VAKSLTLVHPHVRPWTQNTTNAIVNPISDVSLTTHLSLNEPSRQHKCLESLSVALKTLYNPFRLSTTSEIRHYIEVNVQKELDLLVHSLKALFERTQNMVSELKQYRLQVQAMENRS
jgi:hypothetical protein